MAVQGDFASPFKIADIHDNTDWGHPGFCCASTQDTRGCSLQVLCRCTPAPPSLPHALVAITKLWWNNVMVFDTEITIYNANKALASRLSRDTIWLISRLSANLSKSAPCSLSGTQCRAVRPSGRFLACLSLKDSTKSSETTTGLACTIQQVLPGTMTSLRPL